MTEPKKPEEKKQPRAVSERFPTMSLEESVEKAKMVLVSAKRYEVSAGAAIEAMDLSPKGSRGTQALATLKYYGLLDKTKPGHVKVSDLGIRILEDESEDPANRLKAKQEAAVRPEIFQRIAQKYPEGLPGDGTVRTFLKLECRFHGKAIDDVLDNYKRTIAFAGLDKGGILPEKVKLPDAPQEGLFMPTTLPTVVPTPTASGKSTPPSPLGIRRLVLPVEGGELQMAFPEAMSKRSFKMLKDILESLEKQAGEGGGPT